MGCLLADPVIERKIYSEQGYLLTGVLGAQIQGPYHDGWEVGPYFAHQLTSN